MLGFLSLMACTLLLAAVPSLSSSLQPREEVNLPAIGYVMSDGVRTGICPVGEGETTDISLSANNTADLTVYFGDSYSSVSDFDIVDSYVLVTYDSDDGLLVDAVDDLNVSSVIFIATTSYTGFDVYLPDLSYWALDGITYSIVLVFSDSNVFYSVYGNHYVLDEDTGLYALSYVLAELGEDVNPVGAIGDGLGVIGALGGALSFGFDGVFLDNGALTSVGTFSFVLLGLGISVGIVKKCFNWVTGRHGM